MNWEAKAEYADGTTICITSPYTENGNKELEDKRIYQLSEWLKSYQEDINLLFVGYEFDW